MKLTIIGHWGAYPEAGEATSGYLLEAEGFKILIDCGSGVLSQLQNFCRLEELDAVIISHYHHDHIADIGPLQYSRLVAQQLKKTNSPLKIYGHPYDQAEFGKLAKPPYVQSFILNENAQLKIGPFQISFLKTNHKAICFAMRFEVDGKTIVYSADSSYKEEFKDFAKDANLFICETSFYGHENGKPYGHMNSIDAATIARDANVKKLVMTHLPHFGVHDQLVAEAKTVFKGEILLAKKGLTFTI